MAAIIILTLFSHLQALPAFRSLLLAKSPVALSLKNCAAEPLVIRSVQARVCMLLQNLH